MQLKANTANTSPVSLQGLSSSTLVHLAHKAMFQEPEAAMQLAEQALIADPDCEDAAWCLAESLARAGRLQAAEDIFAHLEGIDWGALQPTRCPVCRESDSALAWIGGAAGALRRWVRCTTCRTVRDTQPPQRTPVHPMVPLSGEQLHQSLRQADQLIERLREEGFGEHWLHRPASVPPRASLLEVGAGQGVLLAAAGWRGFDAQGVESHPDAMRWARERLGVMVFADLASVPSRPCDVIIISADVTALPRPTSLLTALSLRLVSGGLLALTVPLLDHPLHRIRGYDDPLWTAPSSRALYERGGLSLMLIRAGLQPVRSWDHPDRPAEAVVLARKVG